MVFQGEIFRDTIDSFNNVDRRAGSININAIILSNVQQQISKNHVNSEEICNPIRHVIIIYNNLLLFVKYSIKAIYKCLHLTIDISGDNQIWILKPPGSLRPTYLEEYDCYSKLIIKPSTVTWEYKFNNFVDGLKHVIKYIQLLHLCRSNAYTIEDTLDNAYLALQAIDLLNCQLWVTQKPLAILSLKDFSGVENAIIQIANTRKIPTFTTQHAVHHIFKGKNYRGSDIVLKNIVSTNIFCWGEYICDIIKTYYPNKANIILSSANFIPKLSDKLDDVNAYNSSYVFALGGRNHFDENIKLINFAKIIDSYYSNIILYFKFHPTDTYEIYNETLYQDAFNNYVVIYDINSKSREYSYPLNSIIITGMTGVYYEFLYLGYKVLTYDYRYEMLVDMPRALPPFTNLNELLSQLRLIKNIPKNDWIIRANLVLRKCMNISINETRNTNLIEEINIFLENSTEGIKGPLNL
jgi:hypothetical protein